jgi:hypothetical protein
MLGPLKWLRHRPAPVETPVQSKSGPATKKERAQLLTQKERSELGVLGAQLKAKLKADEQDAKAQAELVLANSRVHRGTEIVKALQELEQNPSLIGLHDFLLATKPDLQLADGSWQESVDLGNLGGRIDLAMSTPGLVLVRRTGEFADEATEFPLSWVLNAGTWREASNWHPDEREEILREIVQMDPTDIVARAQLAITSASDE